MNAMSMFGRMPYGMAMISQFLVGGGVYIGYQAYSSSSAAAAEKDV